MIQVHFLPEAENDMIISAQFYNDRENNLGNDFLNEIEAGINKIKINPKRWNFIADSIQKYLMKRFPFTIYYEYFEREELVVIIAFAHHKRNPNYWKSRIE